MNLSEELVKALTAHELFSINLFGFKLAVTDSILTMWLVMAVIIILSLVLVRNFKTIPEGKQNIVETFVDFVNNFAKGNMGHHGKHFAAWLGTLLLFLGFSNIISIFNIIPAGNILFSITHNEAFKDYAIKPPTKDTNVTMTMAFMTIMLVLFSGILIKGVKGWLHSHIEPVPVMLPFRIMDYFTRIISLSMRLFGNILGAFIFMELIYALLPFVLPAFASIYFDLFDGLIQAYIFVFLTSIYIAEAIEQGGE